MKKIKVMLTPFVDEGRVNRLGVQINLKGLALSENQMLIKRNLTTVGIPFLNFVRPMTIEDEKGALAYSVIEEETPQVTFEKRIVRRSTQGDIVIAYQVKLNKADKNPVFDLGYEDGGMNGSGMTFLPYFPEGDYEITMDWDMQHCPEDYKAIWSYGEGQVVHMGTHESLSETFYAVGPYQSVVKDKCGFYWLAHDGFDGEAVGEFVMTFFVKIAAFFKDHSEPYQVIGRKLPEAKTGRNKKGGTALKRSFMFVYAEENPPETDEIKFLFPHEMVHNWITLNDNPFGTCTWYVEGTAEFYSTVLPYEWGIITRQQLMDNLNKKAHDYYENPMNQLPNLEVGKRLFKDGEATLVPYGRGFFYLLKIDEMIRQETKDEKSLDDIVLAILEKTQAGQVCGNDTWLEEVKKQTGLDLSQDFKAMQAGALQVPSVSRFKADIKVVKTESHKRGTDEGCDLYQFV